MVKISVVVPVYNEEETVAELHRRILTALQKQTQFHEIIFVDDGSTDGTLEAAKHLRPLKLISLQRNYGQTAALDVGIHEARGEMIVLLDADLQNDPGEIPKLLQKISDGYDAVIGWRKDRHDPWSRKFFSFFANFIARKLLAVEIHDFGCGLKAYRSQFIKNFRLWGESQVFLPAVAKERGAKICEIAVAHHPRRSGSAKVKISKMVRGGFDLFSIVFFVKYFSKPLRFFGGWGASAVILSAGFYVLAFVLKLAEVRNFTETPLPLAGSLLAILGFLLFMMGLLAEMMLRIYYQNSEYSPYVIKEVSDQK